MADLTRKRAEDLLQQALDLTPEERSAFLDARCDDPRIREEVDLLLEYERRGIGSFLETPVAKAPGDSAIGGQIGPYEILRELGSGGFGVVYLGEQKKPFQRRVGVKVLKLGMDSRRIVARFEAEKQTLAMMEHPNVAKVLDAGTTPQGRPYFVMEYVPGATITQHCDEQRLKIADRLHLFLQVCEAIQHAHQKGVIHRDIKPSNVLVQDVGGKPLVKVIDFGIAKFISAEASADTLVTQAGEVIGTPEYMAPEQTRPSARNIDTRTDIYQLGVLLYELLVGSLPFDPEELRSAGLSEALRRIREDEPARPSARLTRRPEGLEAVARQRRSDPASLREELKGDLDWINMLPDNLVLSEDAVGHLEADTELPEPIRKLAVDGARARGDHLNYLNSNAWGVVRSPGASPKDYRAALQKIEHVCKLWPDVPSFLNTLGMAQYRVGEHEAAIATLSRSEALRRERQGSASPADCSILAMARQQLGQTREAHAELDRARELIQQSAAANDTETINLLREAEALVPGEAPE